MDGKKSKKEKLRFRLKLINEMLIDAEHKLSGTLFIRQHEAIKADILRLNNLRKELEKKL